MNKVHEEHGKLLDSKCTEVLEIIKQCMLDIDTLSDNNVDCAELIKKADSYFKQQKKRISELHSLALLDGMISQISSYKDKICKDIEIAKQPPKPVEKKKNRIP